MIYIRYGKYYQQNFQVCHRNTYHTKWKYVNDPDNASWFYFNPTYINRTGENVVDMHYLWSWGGKHQLWALKHSDYWLIEHSSNLMVKFMPYKEGKINKERGGL